MGQGFTSTALAALMMGVATPVIAQSSDVARRFEIAAGPLDRSLPEFARQSGLQILYPSALVAGRQSPAVNGDLTSEAALTLLLRDSGLTYRQSRPTVFVLVDPSARAEASGVEAVELDEVVVTGTYLRGADSPSPVTVITQADVARQGRATVAETLAAMPQNFTGSAYEGSANTGADRSGRNIGSATGVNLRGLGADATLVLVNGRRVAGTGSAGDFADISNIPSSAISRADVLLDGASALYGADAVGGVVNIILRSRFEGAETRVRVGGTSDGGAEEFLFSHAGGLSWGSGSIVAAYEYHDRSELQGADRDATADADLRRFGGTDRRLLTASPGNIVRLDAATATYIPLFAIPSGQNGIGLAPGDFLAGRINRTNQLEGQWFLAEDARQREGWKWAEAGSVYQDAAALGRVYPVEVVRSEADAAQIAALSEEYDRLVSETDAADTLPPEVDARLEEIDKALQAFGPDFDYTAEVKARAGVMVLLGHDGLARFERGLVRAEDAVDDRRPDPEAPESWTESEREDETPPAPDAEADEGLAPLSERLVIDLTAHRTMGLRDAVQADETIALTVVVHALALQVFYPAWGTWTPLQLRLSVTGLERLAPGVSDGPAGRRVADRLEAWGARLPEEARDLWAVLAVMPPSDLLDLMACCAGVGLYAVRDPHDRKPDALAHAETLATATGLDMTGTWSATASSYFSRVSKARVLEAVTEATTPEEAGRIAGFKKGDMAEAAERLVEGRGWLPVVLRTAPAVDPDAPEPEGEATEPPPSDDDAYRFAAE